MKLPSVQTLSKITSYPKELRKVLELTSMAELQTMLGNPNYPVKFPKTVAWIAQCYHYPRFHELKMSMADELCETCGVEYIAHGKGSKSPAIEYCNAGDTYAVTLLYVNGAYRVGCWGDYVERGNYA